MSEVSIGGIIERDMDLLIAEELTANPPFLAWFVSKAGVKGVPLLKAVVHSSTTATGETDIELHVEASGQTIYILIENKVDAPLQPRQAERYRERCQRYLHEGACSVCRTVLVAPAKYLGEEPHALGFDFTVRYEELVDWIASEPSARDPRPFKLAILQRALQRSAVGWTLIPSESTTEFWRRYWELATALAPELQMSRPSAKPETSAFIFFRPSGLPKAVKLVHKVPYGNVDIQFGGKGHQLEEISSTYEALLQPGMSIQRASKSAVVRVEVPAIDMAAPFLESEPAVRQGIGAARLLLRWYKGLP